MSAFALDPATVLGNLDAQIARPPAPKSVGTGSFDDHLQQAAQAGSSASAANNVPANAADQAAPAGGTASTAQGPSSSSAKPPARPADGKNQPSRPQSAGNGAVTPDAKDSKAAAPAVAGSSGASSGGAKAAATAGDATAAANSAPSDVTNPPATAAAKSDQVPEPQPVVPGEVAVSVDPIPAPPSAKAGSTSTAGGGTASHGLAKPAGPIVSPTPADATGQTWFEAGASKSGGAVVPGSGKAGATSKGQHPRSASGAKTQQARDKVNQSAAADSNANQLAAAGAPGPEKPGDPALADAADRPEQSPAESVANPISSLGAVIQVAGLQSTGTQAESSASSSAAVQATATALESSSAAVNTADPPAVAAAGNLAAGPSSSAAAQSNSASSAATANASGPGGSGGVENARFVQRVAKAFQTAGDQGGSLRLRLSPPELGSLKLNVTVTGGVLNAQVEAETVQARDMLLENLPALRERLAEHNIKIDQFDVELFDGTTGGSSDQPHGNSDPQPAYPPAARSSLKSKASAGGESAVAASPALQSSDGRLNVVI